MLNSKNLYFILAWDIHACLGFEISALRLHRHRAGWSILVWEVESTCCESSDNIKVSGGAQPTRSIKYEFNRWVCNTNRSKHNPKSWAWGLPRGSQGMLKLYPILRQGLRGFRGLRGLWGLGACPGHLDLMGPWAHGHCIIILYSNNFA